MKYIKIGSAYQVKEDFVFQSIITGYEIESDFYRLQLDGKLFVKKHYTWDGPSGAINTKSFVKSSCIHDIFCEMINAGFLPASVQCMADEQMMMINRNQKMWPPRRMWAYLAVRIYQIRKKLPCTQKIYEVA